ncbi:hypothetical protein IVB33_03095 [Bradyrhizobium sp. 24]|nr:hypothetical protein [Bradyrhizobium sp. 37]MCK1307768.1 hypothetical protein [Bradyrhizobium sp. 45]MCK1377454.1 hypothetical protein [Bradyrhizobium sp. 24]MCK1436903.1 hypothetical protein [Bradyrhizobium sp. 15]MCK1600806.1 hypothetical protein [Bradyrhizobium sp. 166]MCK1607632.1 hypothetical protein [Bradyrhizobium sp. 163]MCK1763097.1 hypothetical protein [Bradyrhizobium sp. 136]MCK1775037.1 hypothetical protein [Bradyrhizobium sp. 134]
MSDDLTMRRTVGGETAPDDYEVIWDELSIGRIFRGVGVAGINGWSWSVFLPNVPQRDQHRGGAGSLAEAKARFRNAWDDLHGQISYDEIRKAREIQGRRRPWYRQSTVRPL